MKFKRLPIVFALMLLLSTCFSSLVFAETDVKPNLVSLGDSITYGWNLGEDKSPTQPISEKAFPYLIGNGNYVVSKNISGPGWTSERLLAEIQKPENLEVIKQADVITLDIGSNDFLQNDAIRAIIANPTAPVDPGAFGQVIASISTKLFNNLGSIMGTIKGQNTDAQVIIYNIYNPFSDTLASLYPIGEQFLPLVNPGIQAVALQSQSLYADAYSAFKGKQAEYIIPKGDVHSNEAGQQALAGLSTALLAPGEISLDLTPSTTETTKDPVTITVSTDAEKVFALQWLEGEKTIEDFAAVGTGTTITDNKFQVSKNGTYTVYLRDSKGTKAVKTIKVENIKPVEANPNPGNTENNPVPIPTDSSNNPKPVDTNSPAPTTHTPAATTTTTATSNELPDTASPMYNYLMTGLGLVFAGLASMGIQQARKRKYQ
ncbi:GDSL-type esterase/lipase family protein [Neobacillus jeddahensis]|uniref:GDSL-type esterase/lipase family protein n=1 Tax=Neobacillus jeddahensis TaxID=1461580 RepID=UPI00058DB342|nr:GDSL-type esterase/lipase family protein [Neobacillus jeddahensis]